MKDGPHYKTVTERTDGTKVTIHGDTGKCGNRGAAGDRTLVSLATAERRNHSTKNHSPTAGPTTTHKTTKTTGNANNNTLSATTEKSFFFTGLLTSLLTVLFLGAFSNIGNMY